MEKMAFKESTDQVPPLSKSLSADIFLQHYFSVQGLKAFCQSEGLSTAGAKSDLNHPIETYLRTGQIIAFKRESAASHYDSEQRLTPDTKVIHYKTDMLTRAFFAQHGVRFRASLYPYIREKKEESITYGDLVEFLKEEQENRKNPHYRTKILKSTEWNQFMRDYSEDTQWRKPKPCREAWLFIKSVPGPKTYGHYKLLMDQTSDRECPLI
jgi:hypothetical protein